MPIFALIIFCALLPMCAVAQLLPEGASSRVLPLTMCDGRPMIAAEIAGRAGVVMFDTGTPYLLMMNRDSLTLPDGQEVARGHAASGQEIVVMLHPAPAVSVAGEPLRLTERLPSGNFGFTREGLGADFLGFIGLPSVAGSAFVLDLGRGRLTVLPVSPEPAQTLARIVIELPEKGLPDWPGRIGRLPVRFDIDTGDGGTFYVTARTRAALSADRLLVETEAGHQLSGLAFGGAEFGPLAVRVVAAGGPEDLREPPRGDLVRLGASFLSRYPTIWDLTGRTIVVLPPGAETGSEASAMQP